MKEQKHFTNCPRGNWASRASILQQTITLYDTRNNFGYTEEVRVWDSHRMPARLGMAISLSYSTSTLDSNGVESYDPGAKTKAQLHYHCDTRIQRNRMRSRCGTAARCRLMHTFQRGCRSQCITGGTGDIFVECCRAGPASCSICWTPTAFL